MEPYVLNRTASRRLTLRIASDGTLRVSAPWYLPRFAVERFLEEKRDWIEKHRKGRDESPDPGEGPVRVWGQVCRLEVVSPGQLPRAVWDEARGAVTLRVPASWDRTRRQAALDRWEKQRVQEALAQVLPRWEAVTGLKADRWTVKRLRSRWGSCRPDTRSLVLNARLGAYPPVCLDYVVVHELAHLAEPSHNARFHALVEGWMPGAREARRLLRSASKTVDDNSLSGNQLASSPSPAGAFPEENRRSQNGDNE